MCRGMTAIRLSALLFVVVAGGCAAVTTIEGERLSIGSEAFESYVESVFRQQNGTATEIAFELESPGLADVDRQALEISEQSLLEACAALNELAARRRDGRRRGMLRGIRAARQAPLCERAEIAARALIDRITGVGRLVP